MAVAESKPPLRVDALGVWRFRNFGGAHVVAGVVDRHGDPERVSRELMRARMFVSAEQVHGSSLVFLDRWVDGQVWMPGCDALLTQWSGVALFIRSADCLPIFVSDPRRGAVGLAHAGWRGLAARLPERLVAAFGRFVHSDAADLRVAFGPSIRACCYDVSPDFGRYFEPFIQRHEGGRTTCDLVAAARDQLLRCGVQPQRVVDSRSCTACESEYWYSVRREGESTGRLHSFILLNA